MRKLLDVVRLANEGRCLLYNFVPRRGVRYQENLKWVKPEKKPFYHPAITGDLAPLPALKFDSLYFKYKDSKELQNADEKVRKVFSLQYQTQKNQLQSYVHELVEKVKCNAYDDRSEEVQIAALTAKIRHFQHIMGMNKKMPASMRIQVKEQIDRRKKKLKLLRLKDYKRFEWLLEKLDIEYRPPVKVGENKVTRRKALVKLAQLRVEQAKERKLAAYKQELDQKKVPFMEKKIMKLKEIQEKEKKYNLPETVTEEDIKECMDKLEQVKIQVAKNQERGYARKIHPYFLEAYHEDLLWQKEKAAELLREQKELQSQQNSEVRKSEANVS